VDIVLLTTLAKILVLLMKELDLIMMDAIALLILTVLLHLVSVEFAHQTVLIQDLDSLTLVYAQCQVNASLCIVTLHPTLVNLLV